MPLRVEMHALLDSMEINIPTLNQERGALYAFRK